MSPLYDLILQRKGELHTETVQVADAAQAWRLGRERYPHCIRGVVRRDAGRDGIDATAQFFKTQRMVACVARGLTNQGIGNSLGISVETVKTHVVNAKDKLGAADRTQLAVRALLYGLIDPLG